MSTIDYHQTRFGHVKEKPGVTWKKKLKQYEHRTFVREITALVEPRVLQRTKEKAITEFVISCANGIESVFLDVRARVHSATFTEF